MLKLWDCDDPDHLAALLTSELVTNAIRHAVATTCIGVSLDAETLRVEVSDDDPEIPHRRHSPPLSETGRGLILIESLATRWGTERGRRAAKIVWFEVVVTPRQRMGSGHELR
jgi:anti-sigma regulatory factor (Ser/Thr protein kinase)